MCPRLRHGPRLSVETQSDLSWGWMSHAPLALCPCPPGGRHHLADPMHHVSCGVHGPAAFRLALPLDAPRGGPRCTVGHSRGPQFRMVCRDLPYLAHGALSSGVCPGSTESGDRAHPVWAPAARLYPGRRKTRSCTSTLRIIRSVRESGTIPPFHHRARGLCHDSTPVFLPVGSLGPPVAVCHAARCLAQPMHDGTGNASPPHHAAPSTLKGAQPLCRPPP